MRRQSGAKVQERIGKLAREQRGSMAVHVEGVNEQ